MNSPLPPCCPAHVHAAIKDDPARWDSETSSIGVTRERAEDGSVIVMDWRNCAICKGTLLIETVVDEKSILNFQNTSVVSST